MVAEEEAAVDMAGAAGKQCRCDGRICEARRCRRNRGEGGSHRVIERERMAGWIRWEGWIR